MVKRSPRFGIRVVHLACWKPEILQPYHSDWFRFMDTEAREKKREVDTWVIRWNRQFEAREEHVPEKYVEQTVKTTAPVLRRLLLEVFQYLQVPEIDSTVALTCKAWFHVTRDPEYWRTCFISEFNPPTTEEQGNYRRKYISYRLGSCWHCKRLLSLPEISRKCPIFHQPICKTCNFLPECTIISFNSYQLHHKVTQATLTSLNIPSFTQFGTKVSYLLLFRNKMTSYANNRRRILLENIEVNYNERLKKEDKSEVEKFNLEEFYGKERKIWKLRKGEEALVTFCGLCGKREKVQKNVENFLEMVNSKG